MKFAFASPAMLGNLNGLAGTRAEKIEHPDTLEYLMRRMAPSELSGLGLAMVRRLIRMKCLDRFRLFGRFLVVIDGTGHLVFTERHCEHSLTQKQGDKTAAKNYYALLQIAQLIELLVRMGSLLVRELGSGVRELFGGVRKFAEYLRESLRVFVIPAEAFDPDAAARIQIRFDTS